MLLLGWMMEVGQLPCGVRAFCWHMSERWQSCWHMSERWQS